jgi:inner membrane protein
MGRALWLKIAALAGLTLALLIPLQLIESKIAERQATRAAVVQELANTSVGEQTVSGPLLVMPCTEHYMVQEGDASRGYTKEERTRDCTRFHVAETLSVKGTLATENRYRGIYAARFYVAPLAFQGRFDLGAVTPPAPGARREWGAPLVVMSIRDMRGIRSMSALTWNGEVHAFKPGGGQASGAPAVHAALAARPGALTGVQTFSFSMEILGLQRLSFVPSARRHEVGIAADWPHPSFGGRHLPITREVTKDRFEALWRVSELASEGSRALLACGDPACKPLEPYVFGVGLLEPVDVYVQANRAVKYALLFVLLTFAAFFLFEILRDLRIHPVQYGLVGLALAMFFLLLIALSEHIAFAGAYVIAAGACVGLIALYLSTVLASRLRALGFAAMLTALYTMLYALLRSEDYSLLLGALLVFGVLAAIMLLTRRIDWYRVSGGKRPPAAVACETNA